MSPDRPNHDRVDQSQLTDADFERIWNDALAAGRARADAWYAEHPLPAMDCGSGWVNVRPANCRFARWLKRTGRGDTGGGSSSRWYQGVYAPMPGPGWGEATWQAIGASEHLWACGLPAGPCDRGD